MSPPRQDDDLNKNKDEESLLKGEDSTRAKNAGTAGTAASEKSALLSPEYMYSPSPNSTDRPSLTNLTEYGALMADREEGEAPLIQMQVNANNHNLPAANNSTSNNNNIANSFGDDEWPQISKKKCKNELVWILLLLVALFLAITTGLSRWGTGSDAKKESHDPHSDSSSSSASSSATDNNFARPFSLNHPVHDLNLRTVQRPEWSAPNRELFADIQGPLPTNSWYQNLLLATRHEPTEEQRAYPMPYVVDTVGPIPGLRVHHTSMVASDLVLQLTNIPSHGLTLGAASQSMLLSSSATASKKYKVTHMTPLGVTLQWPNNQTTSSLTHSTSIVKGMPYATMAYSIQNDRKLYPTEARLREQAASDHDQDMPTIVSEVPISSPPLLDGQTNLDCKNVQLVQKEMQLQFQGSDYTWLVFVSRPVMVRCMETSSLPGTSFAVQFLLDNDDDDDDDDESSDLIVRMAMGNACTTNPGTCGAQTRRKDPESYMRLLRKHANYYPGPNTAVGFEFETDNDEFNSIQFDWNVQKMRRDDHETEKNATSLLMFALLHHQDMFAASQKAGNKNPQLPSYPHGKGGPKSCATTLLGPACLVEGSTWMLQEKRQRASFRAPRPPRNEDLAVLVDAFRSDLNYSLPLYFQRGAGDTYFSGKMLAKLGRILTIGEELHEICASHDSPKECKGLDVPSPEQPEFQQALARLRSSVEVWINGTADTPFVYDGLATGGWGGVASCGCDFDESQQQCRNQYPDCPGFFNPGLNFGMAFYNDHHFHLGYHIYSAAIVAHFDPQWGRDHFEQVLLLVRDIANPSRDDKSFPLFRNKDWFQGNSWASGIAVSPLNGRNQESSSEAIASYEGVALYGQEMAKAWEDYDQDKVATAKQIGRYGEVLSASELRSADRYYHIIESSREQQFPIQYTPLVIGIMWNTMAQFQTWFGGAAYLAYGIQLLPLTVAAEGRDSLEWSQELYQPFADSCTAHLAPCRDGGWSVLVLAILATVGQQDEAIQKTLELPSSVFTSAGGNGHSLTNTLWYLSTRPKVDDPLVVVDQNNDDGIKQTADLEKNMHPQGDENDVNDQSPQHQGPVVVDLNFNCSCPESCTERALNHFANGHSCGSRILWLMNEKDHNEYDACHQVGVEFSGDCGACDPTQCSSKETAASKSCPPCSTEICGDSKLNQCPLQSAPFLCTEGASKGGCSPSPWVLHDDGICESCCELSPAC
ncbi:Endo-1,3(4)-beta-glucanase [Seminavis robusta]|uniref:glucan endo-1,3-beta-D-glucosidase n=1 Tax=Seminavis robusta TaxID=568900 RepID=A0A9N8D8A6_9STRA|nr:Endo-1,3(4)-beta-glucanase [Seminavis robusta]|eukprot:Sro28_g018920.1 Endo-1,3(4)-beta-glucanase (1213) ;mRNA; f:163800-167847